MPYGLRTQWILAHPKLCFTFSFNFLSGVFLLLFSPSSDDWTCLYLKYVCFSLLFSISECLYITQTWTILETALLGEPLDQASPKRWLLAILWRQSPSIKRPQSDTRSRQSVNSSRLRKSFPSLIPFYVQSDIQPDRDHILPRACFRGHYPLTHGWEYQAEIQIHGSTTPLFFGGIGRLLTRWRITGATENWQDFLLKDNKNCTITKRYWSPFPEYFRSQNL